jgi:hypothetical protein
VLSCSKAQLFPVSYQVQSELLMDEAQRDFERQLMEAGFAYRDLLPLLREKVQRDSVNVYYGHRYCRPKRQEHFAKAVADLLLRKVISC